MQVISANKKANFDYLIKEKYEAGLVLTGSEVKSLRINTGSIKESYIIEKKGELWLSNCYIKKYASSSSKLIDDKRQRKILVHKKELNKILGSIKREGMTGIPLLLYFNKKGLAKLTIGIGKGKKKQDKRLAIKSKEWGIRKQRLEKNK
ncbi:MAG: SsrA-binding protein [Alphaproteobacteria bacterium MarineAlpha5_Bin8]|nr:MAG: SsrA-binding protein [Alphaproteobacteria bacterium MarineAlpha5_Bin8]PPR45866.1 MAG: SsrA-binding protein [Alphaproteobacteria bacterium MarineAlpha5_Bin7]PPR52931.1 MAG: SsrA-binding protein [Alphaproteobacteria bacterium MarineAlpha5_Bin6]|tara:strand:- start:549 stop:995 length:447 start_codon:yes stop_codon:yes gene_type:complete